MNIIRSLFCALICMQSISGFSQTEDYKNEFGFRSDNDSYLAQGQDRYYTNGLFITFRHAMDQSKLTAKTSKRIWEIEAGQKMYNAQSGYVPDITYVDRPFTAYLYAAGTLQWLYKSENTLKVTLQAGTIGPAALGEDAQEFLHRIAGFYKLNGWQYQLNNAAGFNSTIEYNYFLHRSKDLKTDFSTVSYINAGTTYAGAGAGILFRAGALDNFFHSAINNSRISNKSSSAPLTKREFFFFARPVLSYVAYDATVQGGLSSDNKGPVTYGVKPFVFSQELGAMYTAKRWTADFSVMFKSREIKSTAKPHQYGSASLYYRFK